MTVNLIMFHTQLTAADLTPSLLMGNKGSVSPHYATAAPANIKMTGGSC